MNKTLLASMLAILALFVTAPVFAEEDTGTTDTTAESTASHSRMMQMREMRMQMKEKRVEARAALHDTKEQLKANPTPELRAQMLEAAKNYITALVDNLHDFIDRVGAKIQDADVFDTDEAARAEILQGLDDIGARLDAVMVSLDTVTDFAGLREIRSSLQSIFADFRAGLTSARAKIQELRAAQE